jgi:hypothetical protein
MPPRVIKIAADYIGRFIEAISPNTHDKSIHTL